MTDAVGIHDHETKKLGRRDPTHGPAISFAAHLAVPPTAPIADVMPQLSWPMDGNDQWGDCVVAGADHALEAIQTTLAGSYVNWSRDQILAYYRTQNPDFDPATGVGDNGMVIQEFLSYLVKQGVILGFAQVDHTNPQQMDQAIWLGLAIITGETLTVAQQTQHVWDPVASDAIWGGHCTTSVSFPGADRDTCVTWGQTLDMTEAFVAQSVEEAWFIITQAHVDHPGFRAGYDLSSFATEYKALTGRDFPATPPAPTPPPPTPTPTPTPTPVDPEAADQALALVALPWVAERHVGRNHVMQLALRRWLADSPNVPHMAHMQRGKDD